MPADIISSTTQQFLDIHDIVNNFVIMKDGTVSVLITVDAMNFGLLAEEEQDAVMYAYAGLLNSLNYPVQIVINSQTKDVTSYLQLLKDQEVDASNETIRRRIRQYREFVGNLIQDRNVLDKKFYVVIPANSIELGFSGAKSVLPGQSKFDINSIERSILIEKAQNILDPRRDHMIAQFARIGLFSRQLTTQEIIQLFYIRYNPEATEGQQIGESNSYSSPLVQASIQGNTMNVDSFVPPAVGSVATPMVDPLQNTDPLATTQPMPELAPETPATTVPPVAPTQATPAWQPPVQPATTNPTTATPSDTPLDGISNVLGQSAAPSPVAPAWQPPAATPQPVPVLNIPPVSPPLTPSAPPAQPMVGTVEPATTMTASSTPAIANEESVQADLNATMKELGVTPTDASSSSPAAPAWQPPSVTATEANTIEPLAEASAGSSSSQPAPSSESTPAANQAGDLPPLPEI